MGLVKNQPLELSDSSDCYNSIHLVKHTHIHTYICVCVCVYIYIYIYILRTYIFNAWDVSKKEGTFKKETMKSIVQIPKLEIEIFEKYIPWMNLVKYTWQTKV